MKFSHTPFWIRLLDVPLRKRNSSFAYDIGESLGGFLDFDNTDSFGWDEFMRIKVLCDIEKPLRRGVKLATGPETEIWLDIKYERLGDLCYFYGKLGHTDRDCQSQVKATESENDVVYQYGPWLVASPHRHPKMSITDKEKEKKWVDNFR